MTEIDGLVFSYLETYPEEAARVLESLEIEDVAALLASIPSRLGAPVLAMVLPPRAALFLDNLEENSALALLGRLRPQDGASIIRYLPRKKRSRFISQLPAGRSMAYRMLLSYPEETVGAWVDPNVLVMQPQRTAGEALNRFRQISREMEPRIYVVSEGRLLQGDLSLQDVLNAPADRKLEHLMVPTTFTLPAQALMKSIANSEGWHYLNSIAVVEKGSRFIGILQHSTMLRVLTQHPVWQHDRGQGETVSTMGNIYWQLVSSLVRMVVDLLPGRGMQRPIEKGRAP